MAEGGVVREMRPVGLEPIPLPTSEDSIGLRERGEQLARSWKKIPHVSKSIGLREHFDESIAVLAGLQYALKGHKHETLSDDLKWLSDHLRLFAADTMELRTTMRKLQKLPLVRCGDLTDMPRGWILMRGFMDATNYELSEKALIAYVEG